MQGNWSACRDRVGFSSVLRPFAMEIRSPLLVVGGQEERVVWLSWVLHHHHPLAPLLVPWYQKSSPHLNPEAGEKETELTHHTQLNKVNNRRAETLDRATLALGIPKSM